ncbi:hypothetical protein D1631_00020 [Chryseobacterium nematophagum]|uniref:Uncharacterized protein n=1 Tax=Chryseobacterium nematophagum TaxID=2305228 RepID=A0A3M7TK46_9FLAO|nr:hypothetical protein [Chryseobacterium nematophagum]RNA63931.1 hypothetical protein D1631_00020 [Chryseobacterium nematophagum]
MAKRERQDLSAFINKAKETRTEVPIQKVVPAVQNIKKNEKEKTVNFPFNLEQDRIEYLRNFVMYKRKESAEFFHYSNTEAVKEGISYLREKYRDLKQRPEFIKHSTRVGTNGLLNGVVKVQTTFSIPISDREFIYNLVFAKDSNPTEYNKANFFDELLDELQKRYPSVSKVF